MTALDERTLTSTSTAYRRRPGAAQSIELPHLRYFVALADAGSFTNAAQRIFIAQPALQLAVVVGRPERADLHPMRRSPPPAGRREY